MPSRDSLLLLGPSEIALAFKVSRQRVHQLGKGEETRHPLPRPIARLRMGPVYDADDIIRWAIESGRDGVLLPDDEAA